MRRPMEPGIGADDSDDIQAQILQTTLAEVETLRKEAADSSDGDAQHARDCCVICLDSISDPCAALPCSHANFDFLCLVSWLEQHPNCPLCKANVYKVRYADAQKGEAVYRVPNAARTRDAPGQGERADGLPRQTRIGAVRGRRFASQNGLLRDTGRGRHSRPPPTADEAIQRRRHVYRHNLYSLHIGSNRISQYRTPPTPAQFASTPHLVSRARLWLRRELQVFSFLSDPDTAAAGDTNRTTTQPEAQDEEARRTLRHRRSSNAEFLLEYIVAILKTVDVQGSAGQAEAMLADFLGRDHARLFLHELRCWLRSPAQGLAAWDREVQYPEPRRESEFEFDSESESGSRAGLDDGRERGGPGRSWRDREGDHWRAGPATPGRRKRRWGETGGEDDRGGRASRPRRDPIPRGI